jgi:hypothetical protein
MSEMDMLDKNTYTHYRLHIENKSMKIKSDLFEYSEEAVERIRAHINDVLLEKIPSLCITNKDNRYIIPAEALRKTIIGIHLINES